MCNPLRIFLTTALAIISVGSLGMTPALAQPDSRKALAEDSALPQTDPRALTGATAETRNLGTVLGIEVRTGAERNVGRIIDLLAIHGELRHRLIGAGIGLVVENVHGTIAHLREIEMAGEGWMSHCNRSGGDCSRRPDFEASGWFGLVARSRWLGGTELVDSNFASMRCLRATEISDGGILMYVRVTTFQADPAKLGELTAKLPAIKAKIAEMNGLVDWYATWRADGQGVIFSVFKDKNTADASVGLVKDIWGGLAGLLKGMPKPENFDHVESLEH